MTFAPDYPGTTHIVPAHPTNYYAPEGHGGVANRPRALVLHTPEEPADDYESTPVYFSQPNRFASTHYYADNDGDWYQLVPEHCAAIANGLRNKPRPAWADPNTSLNWQTLSVEIEGYAATIHLTCPRGGPQWNATVRWVVDRCRAHAIPIDRAHIIGHYEVADNRSDPGRLDIGAIVADAQALVAPPEDGVEEDGIMPVPYVTSREPQRFYRAYVISGGKKVWVRSIEHERALVEAGYIVRPPKKIALGDLKAVPSAPGTPEPDAP